MRLCRFGENRLGLVEPPDALGASHAQVRDVTAALDELPSYRYPLPPGDMLIANLDRVSARARVLARSAPATPIDPLQLLSPVANPTKIIGAPMNYRTGQDEAAIANAMSLGLFLKANGSLAGPAGGIALRMMERQIDHEVELGVIIGTGGADIRREDALTHVAGYAVALDITPHGKEERSLRKSCETYSVLGPWLVTADEIPDPMHLDLQLDVNGERRQQGNTSQMIRDVATMIEYASRFYTLYPGDIFLSGTPAGVGPIKPGDELVATIEKIGTMRVRVRASTN
jgi:2-keto-4-pentenoate hydratase/2-oxohepta-3-ene-1,7-dioic acid hydratase in catechol pathway